METNFDARFAALTGSGRKPFPWQRRMFHELLRGEVPSLCEIPTGLGKTSVIALWLLARASGAKLPRRLVYVVNRRTVVDQATTEVERLRANLAAAGIPEVLELSTLRGQMADNRAWSADPSRPAVICGTVDMIGSRLLFSGYRVGFKTRPLHAGFLGQDTLLVHDEAHLEPAFQRLIESIQMEQRASRDPWPLRVMALTATPERSSPGGGRGQVPFRLDKDDDADPEVAKRLRAVKKLSLHPHGDKELVDRVVDQVRTYGPSRRAVLVFLRTVEDVTKAVERLRKAGLPVKQLTGTMRGHEREALMTSELVQRFMPEGFEEDAARTVVLVSTSAGEVGVNLSADYLVCDLSTFDSMAQRFGRVNRFGRRLDTEIHVFHPEPARLEGEGEIDERRLRTLRLLEDLRGDGSPAALGALDSERRLAAFAPLPTILPATDILFDAWAMTSIVGRLPGRPPVEPYLHGMGWEPPVTQIAWREEVGRIPDGLLGEYPPIDLLDDYPLKPHELLSDRTSRVFDTLAAIAQREPSTRPMPVWVVGEDGEVEATTLEKLIAGDRKQREEELASCTVLLSPQCCRPVDGLFTPEGALAVDGDGDVADEWRGVDEKNAERHLRSRLLGVGEAPRGMRLIRTVWLPSPSGDGEEDATAEQQQPWRWYEVPRGGDSEGSLAATKPVLLDVHSADVEREAHSIVRALGLEEEMGKAVVLAAKLHDLGKVRRVWQRSVGNAGGGVVLAKSGGRMAPRELTRYRHELGSILDAERGHLLDTLGPGGKELALHLIAAHHGRGRPHFPEGELFDPEVSGVDFGEVGLRTVERFATLQRRYGRWGLAYLESLVRAADYAASAHPSQCLESDP